MRSSRSAPAPHGASPLFVAPRRALLLLPLLLAWPGVALAGVALGSLFHYVTKGPNEVSKEVEAEVEKELEAEK